MSVILLFLLLVGGCLGIRYEVTEDVVTPSASIESVQAILLMVDGGDAAVGELMSAPEIILRRIEGLGMSGEVSLFGDACVQVLLPPDVDISAVVDTITGQSLLEFVDFSGFDGNQAAAFIGLSIATSGYASELTHPQTGQPFVTVLDSRSIVDAAAFQSDFGDEWWIEFTLTEAGGDVFGAFTEANIGQPLAIALDGEVLSAPVIQSQLGQEGIISGNFTEEEAQTLALQLRSGVLPVPLSVYAVEIYDRGSGQPFSDLDGVEELCGSDG